MTQWHILGPPWLLSWHWRQRITMSPPSETWISAQREPEIWFSLFKFQHFPPLSSPPLIVFPPAPRYSWIMTQLQGLRRWGEISNSTWRWTRVFPSCEVSALSHLARDLWLSRQLSWQSENLPPTWTLISTFPQDVDLQILIKQNYLLFSPRSRVKGENFEMIRNDNKFLELKLNMREEPKSLPQKPTNE